MQVLYVVEFEVRPQDTVVDLYAATLGSVVSWLSFAAGHSVDQSSLESSGSLALRPNRAGAPRMAVWDVTGAAYAKAIRVEIRDDDQESGSVFVTRLTLGQIG